MICRPIKRKTYELKTTHGFMIFIFQITYLLDLYQDLNFQCKKYVPLWKYDTRIFVAYLYLRKELHHFVFIRV